MEVDGRHLAGKETLTGTYQWGEYAVEPADQEAVQIIENLYGEK